MGHLGHLKEEYRELARRLGRGQVALVEPEEQKAWNAWKEILELLYSPEEAALAAKMPLLPMSLPKLARHLGVPKEELRTRLEPMCDRGVVMDMVPKDGREPSYVLAPPVVGFIEFTMMRAHDSIPKKKMAEALEAYMHADPTFAREVFGHETVIGRAVVHETALAEEAMPDVLDYERATELIEQARAVAVSLCYCRHKASHLGTACDAPMENCLSLNGGAEFVIRRNFGRKVEKAEALAVLAESRKQGLVQIADNVKKRPIYLCNCCGCCCGQLQSINEFGLAAVKPSGFQPQSDPDRCKGCSRCSRACPVLAITMAPQRVAKKLKNELTPVLDLDRCIGCGVCADACKSGAMRMVRRADRPHVPENMIERALRMTLERGRLADLVFDESQRPMLHAILKGILALPPAKMALASEQLGSRFIRAALGRMKDPS